MTFLKGYFQLVRLTVLLSHFDVQDSLESYVLREAVVCDH